MKTGIFRKSLFYLLTLTLLGLFCGLESASAQGIRSVQIDGRRDLFIAPGSPADLGLGTLFKRRGDIQRFQIRNGGATCWNLSLGVPSNFQIRIAPRPNPLQPGTTSETTIAYLGGATPPGGLFQLVMVNCVNPLDVVVYSFTLDNTPKKQKFDYDGKTRALSIRDKSGKTKVRATPIQLNMPIGRGAFNGLLLTTQSATFSQNISFQGRVQKFDDTRRGGKKIIMDGFWRWKMERLGFPGRSLGKFRMTLKTTVNQETAISGNINVTNAGKSGAKDKDYTLSGRFRGKLMFPDGTIGSL